ncbi:MerR family transcriptional regulator, partial [Romboutsia weinsteinii]
MEYTSKKFAELSGVSVRTLRYYDEIGLLKPCRINSSGYRIYGEEEVDLLQQILIYRSMDMKLEDIQKLIYQPDFNIYSALEKHYNQLISRKNQLEQLILTVEKTLEHKKGEREMSNKEKFEAFKKNKLEENEAKYGNEIREKYGKDTVEASNKKWMNMNEEDINKMQEIEREMFESLSQVINSNDLDSEEAQNVYEKHKVWLCFSWPVYSAEAHMGLAEMYVADERFAKYYNDRGGLSATEVLRDII